MSLRHAGVLWASLLLVTLCQPGRPLAQTFGKNKIQYHDFHWQVLASPHFDVYYYQGERALAEDVVAIAERANVMLSRDLNHRLGRRVPVILYNSHNDFEQTNITTELLDESTGGFTELFKNRVVIPFTGSCEELRHVLVHELTHAFQFDILYGGALESLLGRSSSINVPLWFAEGMAEYESLGMEPGCEQFMRDGIIHGYVVPLQYEPGGYLVYKQGQSAMAYLVRRYGREKYAELLHRVHTFRSMDRAMERTLGVTVEKFSADWIKDLKKQYWPMVTTLDDPEKFARRLTDHQKDGSYLNTSPAISPDGEKVAYLSDRKLYTDIYLMSAIDGKVLRRLVRGSKSRQFENLPSFRGSLAWSPDGARVAFVAKSGERDEIYLYDLAAGRVTRELKFEVDALGYPAFSPDGRSLAFEGLKDGLNDIYLLDLGAPEGTPPHRLTRDAYDEKDLTFAPDGRLTFASDRHARVDLAAVRMRGGAGTYGIYALDPRTGEVRPLLFTGNEDTGPAWSPDGSRLAFISQRGGSQNLYVYTPADSAITQVTDVIGGIYNVSWSRRGDRLVFSALNGGGWDVFASKEPLASDSTLMALRHSAPSQVFSLARFALPDSQPYASPAPLAAAPVAAAAPLSATLPSASAPPRADSASTAPAAAAHGAAAPSGASPSPPVPAARGEAMVHTGTPHTAGAHGGGADSASAAADSAHALIEPVTREDSLRAEAVADSAHLLASEPYHAHFSPDYLTGGFQYNSLVGFGGSTQFSVSDFLGDHRFFLATDLFTSSLDETNFLALYNYLPHRADWAFGLFHFKNYYFSRVTGLGEQFSEARYFSERNYGLVGEMSYPFTKFRRLDFDLSAQVVRRDDLMLDSTGYFFRTSDTTNVVAAPTISLVNDNTLYSYFGPLDGNRWIVSLTQAVPLGAKSLSYTTVSLDLRRYLHLGGGYSLAFRGLGIGSSGRNPQNFFLGGATTLRGYDNFNNNAAASVLSGHHALLGTLEFRFPFISHIGLTAPLPISIFNVEGVLFSDVGATWDRGLRVFSRDGGSLHLVDPRASYGVGVRAALSYFLIHLDVAWPTQSTSTNPDKNPRWHFSIGPEF